MNSSKVFPFSSWILSYSRSRMLSVLAIEEGVAKARYGEVKHGYDGGSLRELCELYLDDFGLKVVHEGAELLELELPRPERCSRMLVSMSGIWCYIMPLWLSSCIRSCKLF